MEKIKTNSQFTTICRENNTKFVRHKKRKSSQAYPQTLPLNHINQLLSSTNILYPKAYKNRINYYDEEFIESTNPVNTIDRYVLMDIIIDYIVELFKIRSVKNNKNITWHNNSQFLQFQINNLKKLIQKNKKYRTFEVIEELDNMLYTLDDTRPLCLIHSDIKLDNMINNEKGLYLIDWKLATLGDLAYEIAMHFILMNYSAGEQALFINKLCSKIEIDKDNLIKDIAVYNKFELFRRRVLGSNN